MSNSLAGVLTESAARFPDRPALRLDRPRHLQNAGRRGFACGPVVEGPRVAAGRAGGRRAPERSVFRDRLLRGDARRGRRRPGREGQQDVAPVEGLIYELGFRSS